LLWCELTLTASSDGAFNAFGRTHHSVCAEAIRSAVQRTTRPTQKGE
jgi:hypothetical protein